MTGRGGEPLSAFRRRFSMGHSLNAITKINARFTRGTTIRIPSHAGQPIRVKIRTHAISKGIAMTTRKIRGKKLTTVLSISACFLRPLLFLRPLPRLFSFVDLSFRDGDHGAEQAVERRERCSILTGRGWKCGLHRLSRLFPILPCDLMVDFSIID